MPPIHPAMVHFPLALLVFAFIFLIFYLFKRDAKYLNIVYYSFLGGIVGLALAILSGTFDENKLEPNEALHEKIEKHETNAYVSGAVFFMLLTWFEIRKKMMAKKELILFTCIFFLALLHIIFTSYIGGQMVYDLGAGVHAF